MVITLVFLVSFFAAHIACQQFSFPLNAAIRQPSLQVDRRGNVYASAGRYLHHLNDRLELEQRRNLSSEAVSISLSSDGRWLVVCLTDLSCEVYNATNLSAPAVYRRENVVKSAENMALFAATDSFYVGSISSDNFIFLGQYNFINGTAQNENYDITLHNFERYFFGGFVRGNNAYYFVTDNNPVEVRDIRVMRVCHNSNFSALYELTLGCGGRTPSSDTRLSGMTLTDTADGSVVTISRSRPRSSQNYVCLYNVSLIDSIMEQKFTTCTTASTGSREQLDLAWRSLTPFCSEFLPSQDSCHFKTNGPLALDDIENLHLNGRFQINVGQNFITSSVVVTVDEFSFVFLAITNVTGSPFIYGFNVGGTNQVLSEASWFYRVAFQTPVVQLKWHAGLDFIYTVTELAVTKIPVADCETHLSCDSCLEGGNPLCGWCLLEKRCSRNHSCRNSAIEHTRWIQANTTNIMECPRVSTINPTEILADSLQTVVIHLSRNLPPLLNNETYQCYFANDEINFVVEASGTGTTYTCNITNSTFPTAYKSIVTVVSVSLSSSTLGVPFVNSPASLTVYDCKIATNCSQCLQNTNNACGWCVYNKLCSGTSNVCIGGVEGYRQINILIGQNYSDVCPFLDEPSPGEDYLHPVQANRNINLVTRNLPREINGFSYKCQIKGIEFYAMYNNETSLTCLLDAGQLTLEHGASQESVDIAVVWLGNHQGQYLVHKIDSVPNINVILYSCVVMADCCSSCVHHAIDNGFQCGWCERSGTETTGDSCTYVGECNGTAITERQNCPAPVIIDFDPKSGPTEGGTTITLTGKDLGVTYEEYNFDSIKVGVDCLPIANSFIPGRQILCLTVNSEQVFPETFPVIVTLPYGVASSKTMFKLAIPEIHWVYPTIGPKAGGTTLTVGGLNLNIGNLENTSIIIANGTECNVSSIRDFSITCATAPFTGISVPTNVAVSVDLALVINASVLFTYFPNPDITDVTPSSTILAGGTMLTFSGTNMDVVQSPILVVNDHDYLDDTMMMNCTILNSTAITCLAPPLTRLQQGDRDGLNYTIIMDNAPGPNLNLESLWIMVLPNPGMFVLVTTDIRSLINGSVIQITGENLHSVSVSEIQVDIGGETCVITAVDTYKGQLFCIPPIQPPRGSNKPTVTVLIGVYLNYTLASTLNYDRADTPALSSATLYAAVLPLLTIAISTCVIVSIVLACVVCRRANLKSDRGRNRDDSMESRYENSFSQFSTPTRTSRRQSNPSSSLQSFSGTPPERLQVSQKLIIPGRQLQILNKKIGHGEFGDVYVAHLMKWHGRRKKMTVAVKTLKFIHTVSDREKMIAEINKMENLRHPNIMPLLGVCFDAGNVISIVMPFMANGSLLGYLKKQRPKLYLKNNANINHVMSVNKLLLRLCHQVAKGMEYLGTQNVVHRDLAARNCLLDSQGNVRVGDFGLAEDIYTRGYFRQSKSEAVKLPFKWMAPESLRDGLFSEKSDVWSFGITCWEVFSGGRIPYSAVDAISILSLHEKGTRLERPANPACAAEDYRIMVKCWELEPQDRPTFSQLRANIDELLQTAAGYLELKMVLVPPKDDNMDDSGYEIAENPFKEEFESLTISNPLAMELQDNDVSTASTIKNPPVRFAKLSIDASREVSDYRAKASSLTRNHSTIW